MRLGRKRPLRGWFGRLRPTVQRRLRIAVPYSLMGLAPSSVRFSSPTCRLGLLGSLCSPLRPARVLRGRGQRSHASVRLGDGGDDRRGDPGHVAGLRRHVRSGPDGRPRLVHPARLQGEALVPAGSQFRPVRRGCSPLRVHPRHLSRGCPIQPTDSRLWCWWSRLSRSCLRHRADSPAACGEGRVRPGQSRAWSQMPARSSVRWRWA